MCPPSSSDLGYGIAQVFVRVERKPALGKPAALGPGPISSYIQNANNLIVYGTNFALNSYTNSDSTSAVGFSV